MKPEDKEKRLLWIWIVVLALIFLFAARDACDLRRANPELEENAYFLNCDAE